MMILINMTSWLIVYYLYIGKPHVSAIMLPNISAELHESCIMILSSLNIFIHEYMIYDMIPIPYCLGQPRNELRGISRCENREK